MTTKEIRAEAHKEITYIFEELLPEHGLLSGCCLKMKVGLMEGKSILWNA